MKFLTIAFFAMIIQLCFAETRSYTQDNKPISDFYHFANKEWLENIILPNNVVVINQAGILWEKIEDKSVEILNSSLTYGLDEKHLYTLNQLRSFYKCTSEIIEKNRKRVAEVQKNFPMAFGIIFSKITIPHQKEEMIREIIKYLTLSYRYKIENTKNIGGYYKKLFLKKLNNLKIEIGAPLLSNFPKIPFLLGRSFLNNMQLAKSYQIDIGKVKTNWKTPYETDCFYYAGSNKINIYAGTLFDFDQKDNIVYLYATLGRTISHEMTHAFDMVGKNYNMNGKRISWLKKLFSGALFSYNNWSRVYQNLINQFNSYSHQDRLFVNGNKTLQENFADLGGVEVSMLALKMYLKDKYQNISEREMKDFLKKYFLYYARFWKEKGTIEYVKTSFKRLHTPQKFRAIGPIYNQNEFYEIFNIDSESEYYIPKTKRIIIW